MKYFVIALLLFAQLGFGQTPKIPQRTNNYINDYTNLLSQNDILSLREISQSIEVESSAQVVVVITNDVPKEYPIEQYSIDLAQAWGIGQAANDNGLLILICPDNRQSRIEVGYGLEGLITDAYTKSLQVNYFRPNFREGKFYLGIAQALNDIHTKISPEAREQKQQYEAAQEKKTAETMKSIGHGFLFFLLIVFVVGVIIYAITQYNKKKREEEEKAQRERDRIEREIRKKKREEEEIHYNAKAAVDSFHSKFNDIKNDLLRMGNYCSANIKLAELTSLFNNTISNLKEDDKKNHPKLCTLALNQIQREAKPILDKFDIKLKIEKAVSNQPTLDQIKDLKEKAERNLDFIFKYYPNNNFSLPAIPEFLIANKHNEAINLVNALEFDKALQLSEEAISEFAKFKFNCDQISNKRTEILEAIEYIELAEGKFNNAIDKVSRLANNSDVPYTVKNNWLTAKQSLLTTFKVNPTTKDPIKEKQTLMLYFSTISSFEKKCQDEIDYVIAEKARQRQEEENRRRRKREEEEEEERRRRRRREEEEEDERRRNSSITSTSSWSSSSFDSGSSSSDTSFGGGSFGGGGSSDNW